MISFNNKEWQRLILATLVLTLVFAFDDKSQVLVLQSWLLNFFKILIFVVIVLLVNVLAHKLIANKFGAHTEFDFLRFGFKKLRVPKKTPMGIILSLLVMLISNGSFPFTLVGKNTVIEDPKRRMEREWKNLRIYEASLIAASGPISLVLLILIASLISKEFFSQFIFINLVYAFYSLIPIPSLDGGEMLANSPPIYIFTVIFVIIAASLIAFSTPVSAIISGLLIAIAAVLGYLYKVYS